MKKIKLFILFFVLSQFAISQVTPAERAALQAFYDATDGPNWVSENDADLTNNWDFTGPVTDDWFGITIGAGHVTSLSFNPTGQVATSNIISGTLPNEIGDLQWLVYLELYHSNLTGPIPSSISTLTNLQTILLLGNELSGQIPNDIGNLTQLRTLDLSQNELTGEIPISITTMPNLERLSLRVNYLSGEIPIEITDMLQLTDLRLASNRFTGFIYPEYGNLTNLTLFNIEGNLLTGTVPTELGNLINMEDFRIGRQDLTGTLPVSLINMVNVELIAISGTRINGEIPQEYGELTSLRTLYLDDNELTGSIPDSFGNLIAMEWMILYGNNLSGAIPDVLSNMTGLRNLTLSNNQLTGNIPNSFGSLINLLHFSVENNQLTGTIPSAFSTFSNLRTIRLYNNQFEGPIPDFSTLPDFNTLVFENNRFQFGDFENQFNDYNSLYLFYDNPQAKVDEIITLNHNIGENITLTTIVSGTQNHYTWYKDGVAIVDAPDSPTLILNDIQASDAGVYHAEITSDIVTDLILIRNDITLNISCTTPTADNPEDVITCNPYILPTLSADNYYYTDPNASGTQLNAGENITTSETIYVYAGISGCSDENSFTITINPLSCEETPEPEPEPESDDPCAIIFPNFFTPNSDGIHDNYVPITKACSPNGTFSIFDRYAKLIFQTNTIDKTWNGNYNGNLLPSSDYWYRFESVDNNEIISGHFTLKR